MKPPANPTFGPCPVCGEPSLTMGRKTPPHNRCSLCLIALGTPEDMIDSHVLRLERQARGKQLDPNREWVERMADGHVEVCCA